MQRKNKFVVTDRQEIYLILLLFLSISLLIITSRNYILPKTLFIVLKDIGFVFFVGVIISLITFLSCGLPYGNELMEGESWNINRVNVAQANILKRDEEMKRLKRYGLLGMWFNIRFDVLTNQRILRYTKYFGLIEEVNFSDVKSYNYKTSLLTMTMKFETEHDVETFEIVMIKPMQTEMVPILEKLMHQKRIPKNDNL